MENSLFKVNTKLSLQIFLSAPFSPFFLRDPITNILLLLRVSKRPPRICLIFFILLYSSELMIFMDLSSSSLILSSDSSDLLISLSSFSSELLYFATPEFPFGVSYNSYLFIGSLHLVSHCHHISFHLNMGLVL